MATLIPRSSTEQKQSKCACGHLQSEHGATGTRPCLAVVGDLATREFCSCDEFQEKAAKAA